jgi:NACHT domain
LWGTPGRGKSTYLSFLINELNKKKLPCIRHHYFLSLDDTTADRISFSDVAHSLIDQISARYPEAVKERNLSEIPNDLRKWLSACGEYFAKQSKKFYVVVDGLDHVWRERMNIDQMNHLFNYLLPCPKNVMLIVGTQRVADLQLPSQLLTRAPDSAWIEIPAMDERAVHDWVEGQDKAKRLRLHDYARRRDQRKRTLDEVIQAFFDISHGHPLHLIYSFETLVRRGTIVTADEVKILPRCPAGDIRRYYKNLWGRLKPQAKQVLHLVAGADFRWPANGLRRCGGNLDEVDRLLEHRRTGVAPFHGSILAYAREQPDHESTYRALLPKVIRWLEHDAPPFWRWGWLWIVKARNGKPADLLAKPTRKWVIDSLADGWPDAQIIAILRQAEIEAFSGGDYRRCIELRSLKVRVQNGPEFQMYQYPEFIEAALRSSENEQQVLNMADEIGSLPDAQLVALLRSLPEVLSEEIGKECEAELRRRVNL